ncbi:MAG: hypothetical protein P8H65_11705 [Rhodothermales bacterium]|nr:hypothetical protein [Rhodothermales bacterium]MDG2017152.1 hypothetical protein [Rhodothermales bacterium]HAY37448.1 hypothetical protein [Bacteroidota bacterium]
MENTFKPQYNKPDAPGIAMNFDNTVSIYQVIEAEESFEEAARSAFDLLLDAQARYPDWPRVFYLEVNGHTGEQSGFDADLFEFQQEFWFSTIAHFVSAFETPMLGGLINPNPQRNDIPDGLQIGDNPETGSIA